jgi:hypothetical protein
VLGKTKLSLTLICAEIVTERVALGNSYKARTSKQGDVLHSLVRATGLGNLGTPLCPLGILGLDIGNLRKPSSTDHILIRIAYLLGSAQTWKE